VHSTRRDFAIPRSSFVRRGDGRFRHRAGHAIIARMSLGFAHFKAAADKLGVRIDPPASSFWTDRLALEGSVAGVRVRVDQWRGQFVHVEFRAYLNPPADLRLSIRRAGVLDKLSELLGLHDIAVGDARFDHALEVRADEPARARALLTPALRAALLGWAEAGADFEMTDEIVSLNVLPGAYSTMAADEIERDVRAAVALVRAANEALPAVPPSTILAEHVAAWRAYAGREGLQFLASPLSVWGRLAGEPFAARAAAIPGRSYGVHLRLQFEQRLPWLVRARPARWHDFLERTGDAAHVATGDTEFDREFRVTTTDAEATRAFFDEGVRAALLGLDRDEGAVVLDADGLALRMAAMTAPEHFGRLVERVGAVARKLHEQAAPYRGPGR
jgi:hypothetical protein